MATSQNPVNWFEIPVTDIARATAFYQKVLDLTLSPMQMGPATMATFPMVQDGPHATGCLIASEGYTPSHAGTVVYFAVPDIEAALDRVTASGGKTLVPKMSIGEHGFVAHFEDTEGNRAALHAMS